MIALFSDYLPIHLIVALKLGKFKNLSKFSDSNNKDDQQ